ncbi:MAG: hypothetical protein WCF85_16485 [Rhodospirillaceae bacterium]
MQIMESRLQQLDSAFAGLNATGVPLVAKIGNNLSAAGQTDDVGIYYYIPVLARWLNLEIYSATHVFYYGLCFGAALVALICFFTWFDSSPRRLLVTAACSIIIALFFSKARSIGDVYLLNICAPLMLIPLVALGMKPGAIAGRGMTAIVIAVGGMVPYFEFARSHSAAPVIVFTLTVLLLNFAAPWWSRLRDGVIFLLVIWLGMQSLFSLVTIRDRYLMANASCYQPVSAVHPLWHSVYIGLAFLPNTHGVPEYSDTVASDFVRSVDPKAYYLSQRYEKILRTEVRRIAIDDPGFIARTLFAKLTKMVSDSKASLLLFAIGLLAGARDRARRHLDVGLVLALGVSMMPGLLVWPASTYYLGLPAICLVTLLLGGVRLMQAGPPWGDEIMAFAQRYYVPDKPLSDSVGARPTHF